jgi:threo-3-hydroxy-L-aspartate ammonia-lyase
MMSTLTLPSYADVVAAAARLEGHAERTPVLRCDAADALLGAEVFFKCENLQRTGSFKFRGAYNAVALLTAEQARRGVVTYSSGNHGQALALAARLHGVAATVVIPHDAPRGKLDAVKRHGATVISFDRYAQDRDAVVAELLQKHGFVLVPPADHVDVIAGQATTAQELLAVTGPLDSLFVCLGGGGLLAGCSLVVAQRAPQCQLFGVEPEAGNDGQQSLRTGQRVRINTPRTIADGAQAVQLAERAFPLIQQRVRDIHTVSDVDLVAAMRFLAEELRLVVEPTGCLAWAGALQAATALKGQRVGIVLTGGNVDLSQYSALLANSSAHHHPSKPNRGALQ